MKDQIETVARALYDDEGQDWNAADFTKTASGETPEEQRDYWRAKAKAALAVMPPVPQWQGIESAPRDGTIILLGLPIVGNLREVDRRVYEGRWHEEQKIFTSVNGFILLAAATHWMPLPTPPAGGSDAE